MIRPVIASDDAEPAVDHGALVLKDHNPVVRKVLSQFRCREVPVSEVAVVVVAVDKINAVLCLEPAEGTACADHVFLGTVVVHEVTYEEDYIGIELMDPLHLAGEGLSVQCYPEMRVGDSHNAEAATDVLVSLDAVACDRNIVGHDPSDREVYDGDRNRQPVLQIISDFLPRDPAVDQEGDVED